MLGRKQQNNFLDIRTEKQSRKARKRKNSRSPEKREIEFHNESLRMLQKCQEEEQSKSRKKNKKDIRKNSITSPGTKRD